MDNSIVEGFQNLQVLAPFDFGNMGALVQDLTYALEESTKGQNDAGPSPQLSTRKQVKKRKSKKRNKPESKSGNKSDVSESSTGIEEALKEFVETVTQHSDSDDVIVVQRLSQKKPFQIPACHQLFAESDSFTENFSPMRPHRRRRKFKRMAVDPKPDGNLLADIVEKQKRVKHKSKCDNRKCDMDVEGNSSLSDTLPGKRKHLNGQSESVDASDSVEDSSEMCPTPNSVIDLDEDNQSSQEYRESSSISSTDSEPGLHTPDEARDGDDEQSDFFHEPGPACGIPGIIPWWNRSQARTCDSDQEQDPDFKRILNGSFELMSLASQRSFKSRIRLLQKREIRAGRRRLKDRKPAYSVARFLQDRQQWKDHSGLPICSGISNQSGDFKRRKKTPPNTPTPSCRTGLIGAEATPISEENIGSRLLQSMGWKPGSGLGTDGSGITQPIMAYMRPHKRQGLGMDASPKS